MIFSLGKHWKSCEFPNLTRCWIISHRIQGYSHTFALNLYIVKNMPWILWLLSDIHWYPSFRHPTSRSYWWWKKSCTSLDVWNTANNGIFTISTGAGFPPSAAVNLVSETEAAFSTENSKHAALPHRRAPAAKFHGTLKKLCRNVSRAYDNIPHGNPRFLDFYRGYISPIFLRVNNTFMFPWVGGPLRTHFQRHLG